MLWTAPRPKSFKKKALGARVTMNWFTLDTILSSQLLARSGKPHELQPKVDGQGKKAIEQTNQVEPRPNPSPFTPSPAVLKASELLTSPAPPLEARAAGRWSPRRLPGHRCRQVSRCSPVAGLRPSLRPAAVSSHRPWQRNSDTFSLLSSHLMSKCSSKSMAKATQFDSEAPTTGSRASSPARNRRPRANPLPMQVERLQPERSSTQTAHSNGIFLATTLKCMEQLQTARL